MANIRLLPPPSMLQPSLPVTGRKPRSVHDGRAGPIFDSNQSRSSPVKIFLFIEIHRIPNPWCPQATLRPLFPGGVNANHKKLEPRYLVYQLGKAWPNSVNTFPSWTHSRLKNSLSDLVRRQSLPGWIPCHPLVKGNRGKPRHVP